MFTMKKIIIGIVGLGILIVAGVVFFMLNVNKEKAAIVNGEDILLSEFEDFQDQFLTRQGIDVAVLDDAAKDQIKTMILDMLISQKLLAQAATDADIVVTAQDIDTQLSTIKSQFPDEATFAELLKTENLTEGQLKDQLKKDLLVQKYVNQQFDLEAISVSEAEVTSAYELISATQEIGELAEVRANLEQYVKGQKQQELIAKLVEDLRASADIDIRI